MEDPKLESNLSNLNVGDLVEFPHRSYSHWAVYIGNKELVHLTGVDEVGSGASVTSSASSFSIGGVLFNKAKVSRDNFWEVAKGSRARKNNSKDEKWRPFSAEEIVENALSKLGDVGYNLLFSNCEHFATWCRYGISQSDQAKYGLFYVVLFVLLAYFPSRMGATEKPHERINCQPFTMEDPNLTHSHIESTLETKVCIDNFWNVAAGSKARKHISKDKTLRPLSAEEIEKNVLSKLGDVGYNLLFSNCEHFATWCRYGTPQSDQAEELMTAAAI